MKKTFDAPIDTVIESMRTWLQGFVNKEYSFLDKTDREDLIQDGYIRILEIYKTIDQQRFDTYEKYIYYLRACTRHAIRDAILRTRSRFKLSLHKLRQQLREKDGLHEVMGSIEETFLQKKYPNNAFINDDIQELTKQHWLNILQDFFLVKKKKDIALLQKEFRRIIDEYKNYLIEENQWMPASETGQFNIDALQLQPCVRRTPVVRITPKKCANHLCKKIVTQKNSVVSKNYVYCSKNCKNVWPPVFYKIQKTYNTPLDIVATLAIKLLKNRKKISEVLGVSILQANRLLKIYGKNIVKSKKKSIKKRKK